MIRRGVLLGAGLLAVAVTAMAASFSVAPTTLQSFTVAADIDVPDPPDGLDGPELRGRRPGL